MNTASFLERDIFSEEYDIEWRAHLAILSDRDLLTLDPEIFCAGLLARLARIKKAYAEEMARRKLKPRTI